jgi:hypothetical protein
VSGEVVDRCAEHRRLAGSGRPDDGDQRIGAGGQTSRLRLCRIEAISIGEPGRPRWPGPSLVGPAGDSELLIEDRLRGVAAVEH